MRSILLKRPFCKAVFDMDRLLFILWNLHTLLESLPISSSSHLQLFIQRLHLPPLKSTQLHVMHIPTIMIITLFLWPAHPLLISCIGPLIVPDIISGILYVATTENQRALWPLWVGFSICGFELVSLHAAPFGTISSISPLTAIIIGIAQALALLPGISRLAATCVTGIWLGIDPTIIFYYSLACELPLLLLAVLRARKEFPSFGGSSWLVLLVSAVGAYSMLYLSLAAFTTGAAVFFGWYLLLLAGYLCWFTN